MKKLIILLLAIMSINSFAYINITPTTFDKRIDNEDGVSSFYISNSTKDTLAYRIYIEKTDSEYDMSDYIEIYPKSLKLKTGETKEIKMQINAPKTLKKGEYISNLVIKEVENPENRGKKFGAKLKIYTELKIEIAGYVGDIKQKFALKDIKKTDGKLTGIIKNIGDRRAKVDLFLSNSKNKSENDKYITSVRLLSNQEKELNQQLDSLNYKFIKVVDVDGNTILVEKLKE